MLSSRPFTLDRITRIVFTALLIAAIVWLVGILENVLLPFCLACLISYLLEPLVELNQRMLRTSRRAIPSFLTLAEVAVFVIALLYFFLPSIINEVNQIGDMLSKVSATGTSLHNLSPDIYEWLRRHFNFENIDKVFELKQIEQIVDSGASIMSESLGILFRALEWLITFIYVIFILIDYPQLMKGFRLLVPPRIRPIAYRVADDIKLNMNRYFRSQALIAACAAVFYCIGFSIVGIPLAIVLGIMVGVLYMIPYFQYITLIPVAIVCLIASLNGVDGFWTLFGECLLVYVVSQSVCDYVLTPKIMGKAMGLNPAIILLSLSVWGTLMGLIGMIIALPLTTLLLGYYQEYVIDPADDVKSDNLL